MSDLRKKPEVLIISKEGSTTGAGNALYRIHLAINKSNNFSSKFLAWEGVPDPSQNFFVNENFLANKIYRRIINVINKGIKIIIGPKPGFTFSPNLFPNLSLKSNKLIEEADIIFLGWVGFGYLSISQLKLFRNKKILWRFSDVWAFTGGCHVPFGCEKFKTGCHSCPQLKNSTWVDLTAWLWKLKKRHYQAINIKFIAPSKWMKDSAKSSPLLLGKEIYHVPTGVDLTIFKSMDKASCRNAVGVTHESTVVLFGSVDTTERRKGFRYLIEALKKIEKCNLNLQLIVFGNSGGEALNGVNFPIKFLGRVEGDENLATVYNAADVFLAPYIDDNLPNTVIEAISCGLPVVGFNSGGMSDLVENKGNGYLSVTYDSEDFAKGICWVIENLNKLPFSERSRAISLNFSSNTQNVLIERILNEI